MTTLRDLHPLVRADLQRTIPYHSLRSGGSFRQILRRPTKLFETLRKYIVGDPVQYIDWKVYARTDQLLLRERKEEASISVAMIIDINDSMAWPGKGDLQIIRADCPEKKQIAWRIGMYLAFSHLSLGDVVNIYTSCNGKLTSLRSPRSGMDVLQHFSNFLADESGFEWPSVDFSCGKVEKLWLITDGINEIGQLPEVKRQKNIIHLLSHLETNSSWIEKGISYFDRSKTLKEYKGDVLSKHYQSKFRSWIEEYRNRMAELGFQYFHVTDQTTLEHFKMEVARDGQS